MARYADACNLFATSPDDVAHKLDVLARHCEDAGRDPASIRRTLLYLMPMMAPADTEGLLSDAAAYAKLGVDEIMVMPPTGRADAWIEQVCAPVVPLLAEI